MGLKDHRIDACLMFWRDPQRVKWKYLLEAASCRWKVQVQASRQFRSWTIGVDHLHPSLRVCSGGHLQSYPLYQIVSRSPVK